MPGFAGFKDSLWTKTAVAAPEYRTIEAGASYDVVIVGAGFTGLSTGLELAKQGKSVAILDMHEPGWGASGRNGGQIIPGMKWDPEQLIEKLGRDAGEKIFEFSKSSSEKAFKVIEENNLNCSLIKNGWFQPIHNEAAIKGARNRARQWRERGVDVKELTKEETDKMLGSDNYVGALFYPNGGTIQPLSYARELARVMIEHGGHVYKDANVTSLNKSAGKWEVVTPDGTLTANKVLVATNGYTGGLVKNLDRTIVDLTSFIVASKPLSPEILGTILPGRQGCSDTRRILTYMRVDDQGRLLLGGRGSYSNPVSAKSFKDVESKILQIFPQLKDVEWEHRWFGRFAVTDDFLPHIHEPEPGLICMLGYSGRGVSMGSAIGKPLAEFLVTGDAACLPLAITPLKPIPFYAMRRLGIITVTNWYRFLDMWG